MPNVYVVDDDVMVRHVLSQMLSGAGFAARSFGSAEDFLDAAPTLAPGCLVADVRMPGMNGLELLQTLVKRDMSFPVVVMTAHADVPMAVGAIKAGAVDFVEKPFSGEAILGSIARAQDRLQRRRAEIAMAEAAHAHLARLTRRDRQVLECLVAGQPNKVIAYELGLSRRTVEHYRARIMAKMQAASLSGLVRLALAAGIKIASDD
jgi:two-component system, LuxR family, response regulator FixJ